MVMFLLFVATLFVFVVWFAHSDDPPDDEEGDLFIPWPEPQPEDDLVCQ